MPPAPPGSSLGFWDLAYRAADHLEHWDPPRVPPELVAALEEGLVRPGQRALDIGCGSGTEALFLAERGVEVLGVDSSPVALELARAAARERGLFIDWRLGDVTKLPVEDGSIDFALDRGCFHVISRRRRPLYAAEVARVLRPGARLLLRGAREDDDESGLVGFDRAELERLFAPLGLRGGPLSPVTLEARSGDLTGHQVVLTRVDDRHS